MPLLALTASAGRYSLYEDRDRMNQWQSNVLCEWGRSNTEEPWTKWTFWWLRDKEWMNSGTHFLGVYFPPNQEYGFPYFTTFPHTELNSIPLPSQGINCLNQLLEDLNNWVHRTKRVVDIFMGSPIDIWLNTIGSRVWIISLPIPCEIMCPSLVALHS